MIKHNHVTRELFLVGGCFLRQVLGVCSIRIFAKNIGDPYYEPTIMGHDTFNLLVVIILCCPIY